MSWNYAPLFTAEQVQEAERFLRGLPSATDLWFAKNAPAAPAPKAHESLIRARQNGPLKPVDLCGTALRFDTWFRVGPCADPLWSEAEVFYQSGSLSSSLCRIRDGRDRCELLLNHRTSDVLLNTAGGGLDLRLSDDFGRVLVRLDGNRDDDALVATALILTGDFTGWSLKNNPIKFRQVGFKKFVIEEADILEVSAVVQACCPKCPIRAETVPPRRRPRRPARRAAAFAGPHPRIRAAGGLGCVASARGEGKLPTFKGIAYSGSPMRPAGFWGDVIIDLDGVKIPSQATPALKQHDHQQIMGHCTRVRVTNDGIQVEGVFSGQSKETDKVVIPARNGFPWQLSVGADPIKTEFLEAGEEDVVNRRKVTGPMTISRETILGEISFVPLGADRDTSVDVTAKRRRADLATC